MTDPAPILTPPTPGELRNRFERLIVQDLLGPRAPEEEVDANIIDHYLLGKLAPKGAIDDPRIVDPDAGGDSDDPALSLLTDAQGDDFLPVTGTTDETSENPEASGPRTLFPSSIGLSFSVDAPCRELLVTASWGRYERRESEEPHDEPTRIWKRIPVMIDHRLPLLEGEIAPIPLTPEGVILRGRIRRRPSAEWSVTLFLENTQTPPKKSRGAAWLFQTELRVRAVDGTPVFIRRAPDPVISALEEELRTSMRYRKQLEFAIGHGVGVDWDATPDEPGRATEVRTVTIPTAEVPATAAPQPAEVPGMESLVLGMSELAALDGPAAAAALTPLADAYERWIEVLKLRSEREPDLAPYKDQAFGTIKDCREAAGRIRAGIDLLRTNPDAAASFAFMNEAMALQRVHALWSLARRTDPLAKLEEFDKPENRRWRPFQIAFILLSLPALADPLHPDRRESQSAVAELLWFPTGGGKTEAYLGLAAFAMAIRRLQGSIAGREPGAGLCVLMRYTMRLLTLQQFQRATTLVCAMEVLRTEAARNGDHRWGDERFRIGLWVGSKMTPNTTNASAEAVKKLRAGQPVGSGSPDQLTACPWCGTAIDARKDITVEPYEKGRGLTKITCGNIDCAFSARRTEGEGLPVLVVDEEIYRRLPALLIATVDKFAMMPWKGETGMLFGQVRGYCPRHGWASFDGDLTESDSHPKSGSLPGVHLRKTGLLRPPDLIIQDELHLISGPLGSMVGLYETAIDDLCTMDIDGVRVRPKVIASTATTRQAPQQIHALFARTTRIFPPQGLDASDSFFARQVGVDERPGRRYIGILARGERLKNILIRTYVATLSSAAQLYKDYGDLADPYMTLVGYFGSMRELGGTRRVVDDDVQTRLQQVRRRGLAPRETLIVKELTGRVSSSAIPNVLAELEVPYRPRPANAKRDFQRAIDVLLATNMVAVGVDVPRLGLMVVDSQPKTTAEYIQATSRVGRLDSKPGLVITVFNFARARDLSHYEKFRHYHETYYAQVEALSVTPFAPGALDRGLAGVLTSMMRLGDGSHAPNQAAAEMHLGDAYLKAKESKILSRADAQQSAQISADIRETLDRRIKYWWKQALPDSGAPLGYEASAEIRPLLTRPDESEWKPFTCLTSLRDVEPEVKLVLIAPEAVSAGETREAEMEEEEA